MINYSKRKSKAILESEDIIFNGHFSKILKENNNEIEIITYVDKDDDLIKKFKIKDKTLFLLCLTKDENIYVYLTSYNVFANLKDAIFLEPFLLTDKKINENLFYQEDSYILNLLKSNILDDKIQVLENCPATNEYINLLSFKNGQIEEIIDENLETNANYEIERFPSDNKKLKEPSIFLKLILAWPYIIASIFSVINSYSFFEQFSNKHAVVNNNEAILCISISLFLIFNLGLILALIFLYNSLINFLTIKTKNYFDLKEANALIKDEETGFIFRSYSYIKYEAETDEFILDLPKNYYRIYEDIDPEKYEVHHLNCIQEDFKTQEEINNFLQNLKNSKLNEIKLIKNMNLVEEGKKQAKKNKEITLDIIQSLPAFKQVKNIENKTKEISKKINKDLDESTKDINNIKINFNKEYEKIKI